MYRSSPARKYGPLALLAAVQLVVVLVAPSTAQLGSADALGGGFFTGIPVDGSGAPLDPGATGATTDPAGAVPGTVLADGTVVPATGSASGGSSGATVPAGGGTATSAAGSGTVAPAATGDTSHCVDGRQFDPKIEFFAPPCVAGKPGAAVAAGANGGATSMGVTADRIDIVHYIPDYGAEVNAILRAQGLYYDASNARIANEAFAAFINSKYQLSGRQIRIQTFQGTCRTVPPDLQCLIPEMQRVVATYKPYAVFFQTTVCSACYAELARLKVVSFGGAGFSEEFRGALKPYNYDYNVSSTRMAELFAQWWCGQLDGKNAIFAGGQNPAQDFRGQKRQLGVVSTNDPDNQRVVEKVLYPALKAGCGADVDGHEYFYEQNVSTAAQQSQAGTAVMNSPQNPATSFVCFCDPVAPQFSYNAATNNNYWPEVLLASVQAMDSDSTGQSYMGQLACPQSQRGCAFDGAFGLGSGERSTAPANLGGSKVFAASSKAAVPLEPVIMEIFWQNYNMLASLLQVTGPQLTPARMAAAAPLLGARGGGSTGFSKRVFADGQLSWTRDVAMVSWSKNKKSVYNGVTGAFTQAAGGRRFDLGEFPAAAQPPVPTADKRTA